MEQTIPPPGPELDRLVAEKVMGWHESRVSAKLWRKPDCIWPIPKDGWEPSTDRETAMVALEDFTSEFYMIRWRDGSVHAMICCPFDRPQGRWCTAKAKTAPHAICLALIKAATPQKTPAP